MAKLTAGQKFKLFAALIDKGIPLLCSLVRWTGIIIVAYFAFDAVKELSGETTAASFMISFLGSVEADRWVWMIVAGLSLGYGYRERSLRSNKVKQMGEQIEYLEQQLDPNRSSSNLTKTGSTRKEDK